jgi:hypothetical protein
MVNHEVTHCGVETAIGKWQLWQDCKTQVGRGNTSMSDIQHARLCVESDDGSASAVSDSRDRPWTCPCVEDSMTSTDKGRVQQDVGRIRAQCAQTAFVRAGAPCPAQSLMLVERRRHYPNLPSATSAKSGQRNPKCLLK